MECQEVFVRFADLRRLANTVPGYLAEKVGVSETPTLRTTIEQDFQIGGLDTESLIIEFGEDYRVDLTEFDFTDFISPEPGVIEGFWQLPLLVVFLLYWVLKNIAVGVYWLFNRQWATAIFDSSVPPTFLFKANHFSTSESLTTGDFVASAAAGHFVKRERTRFILIKSRPI